MTESIKTLSKQQNPYLVVKTNTKSFSPILKKLKKKKKKNYSNLFNNYTIYPSKRS